jgi:hypothetical protein
MPIAKIAEECKLTVGQVKYQLRKAKQLGITAEHAEPILPETAKHESVPMAAGADTLNKEDHPSWKLPSFYARDLIKLMAQGPTVLFAYWEITWPRMRMIASYFQADYQTIHKGIRLYDVTDRYFDGANAHSYRDVDLPDEASSWYIREVEAGRTYIVDFGLFHQGRFCPILRSEPAATPRSVPAVWGEPLIAPAKDVTVPEWFENFSSYSVTQK